MLGVGVDMLLCDVMIVVGVTVLCVIEITVMDTPAITLEFMVRIASSADVLAVVITDVISDIDVLADEGANGLAAVVTPSEFTLPSPWEESMSFC